MIKRLQIFLLALLIHSSLLAQFESSPTMLGGEIVAKLSTSATQVTLTLTGPINRYFAIGFGGMGMFGVRDAFIWNASSNLDYNISGRSVSADVTQNWTLSANTTTATTRTVTATRNLAGTTENDFTFLNSAYTFDVIYAYGDDENVAYHASRGSAQITLTATLSLSPSILQVTKQNNTNTLTWQTINNTVSKYEVERSTNGINFTTINTVIENNNTSQYAFNDVNTLAVAYYRLKITNTNTSIFYSNIVKIEREKTAAVILFPNPAKKYVTLQVLDNALIGTTAILTNAKGSVLKKITITLNQQLIDVGNYATGLYIIKLANGETVKLLKK